MTILGIAYSWGQVAQNVVGPKNDKVDAEGSGPGPAAPDARPAHISDALQAYWWVLALAVVALVLGVRLAMASPAGRLSMDRLLLRLPLGGTVILKTEVARWAWALGTLLRCGVPVINALSVVREITSNQVLVGARERLVEGVKPGAGLSSPMAESGIFPPLMRHMVRIGEETGRLEEMLHRVADTFGAEARKLVKRLTGLLEPVIVAPMQMTIDRMRTIPL